MIATPEREIVLFMTIDTEVTRRWMSGGSLSPLVLDPDLASVLLAFALAGALALPRLRRALRGGERFCESCGRRVLLGERTCDCDH
jgi:hypothetical protein